MFHTFTERHSSIGGIQRNAPALQSMGTGDIRLACTVDGKSKCTVMLTNVTFCPDAWDNLISESRMDRKGLEIQKCKGLVNVLHTNGSILMQGHLNRSLYELNCHASPSSTSPKFAFNMRYTHSLNLWHRCLAHVNEDALLYMAKHSLITRMDLHTNGSLGPCNRCAKGKHPQAPFPKQAENWAESLLGHLHMNIQGPFKGSFAGFWYALAVIDDHSWAGWKRFLKHKNDAKDEITMLITELETFTEHKVKTICFNGRGEFLDTELRNWFKSKGITLKISALDMQQQYGVTEWYNRTMHEGALAMLKDLKLADGFWPEAHEYSNYVCNWTPTAALKWQTLYKAFHRKKPNVSALRVFRSRCHVHVPKEKWGKLDAHSLDRIFCGFTPKSKAYKIWIPSRHKFITSRDVIIYEKLPEHEDEPIATSAPSEGVSQDQGTSSVGATEPTANKSATNLQADPELEKHTIPKPIPTVETTIQPRCSEHATWPTWIKAVSNLQKAAESKLRANNKALRKACTKHHELKAKAKLQLPNMEEPHSHSPSPAAPVTKTEITNFAYLAAHGSITPLSYKEAFRSPESVE